MRSLRRWSDNFARKFDIGGGIRSSSTARSARPAIAVVIAVAKSGSGGSGASWQPMQTFANTVAPGATGLGVATGAGSAGVGRTPAHDHPPPATRSSRAGHTTTKSIVPVAEGGRSCPAPFHIGYLPASDLSHLLLVEKPSAQMSQGLPVVRAGETGLKLSIPPGDRVRRADQEATELCRIQLL